MSVDQVELLTLVKSKNYQGTFVEIGTWMGEFAESVLKSTACKKLYCIDPYKYFKDFSYRDSMNLKLVGETERRFLTTKSRLEAVSKSRVEMIRKTSKEAVDQFEDSSLDFVYIDGNHEYEYVLQDLLAWYPKVKPGGILAGDDVHSTNLEDYSENKNMLKNFDASKTTWAWFGVYPALLDAEKILGIQFTIQKTQFYHVKT